MLYIRLGLGLVPCGLVIIPVAMTPLMHAVAGRRALNV